MTLTPNTTPNASNNGSSNTVNTQGSTTEVKLLGQKIILKSTESDPEIIRQVIQLVSAKLNDAETRSKGAVPHQVALLALLDLAEEYVKAKKKTLDLKSQLDEKSSRLLNLIEH